MGTSLSLPPPPPEWAFQESIFKDAVSGVNAFFISEAARLAEVARKRLESLDPGDGSAAYNYQHPEVAAELAAERRRELTRIANAPLEALGCPPLLAASAAGSFKVAVCLLKEYGADPTASSGALSGQTALHLACFRGGRSGLLGVPVAKVDRLE